MMLWSFRSTSTSRRFRIYLQLSQFVRRAAKLEKTLLKPPEPHFVITRMSAAWTFIAQILLYVDLNDVALRRVRDFNPGLKRSSDD